MQEEEHTHLSAALAQMDATMRQKCDGTESVT